MSIYYSLINSTFNYFKRVEVVDFGNFNAREQWQQAARSVTLYVGHDALLVPRCVDFEREPAVEPRAATALPSIAPAAYRGMVKAV